MPASDANHEKCSSGSATVGERKQVTVLFADVAGFTDLSEQMDPEDVSDLMQPCIDIMSEEIGHYGGTIAQFLGDGLMALFGAPIAHEDSLVRAVHAALSIQQQILEYSRELSGRTIAFEMRVGLNTGLVVVGSVGEGTAMAYTAIGDTVNLASRMESTAEPGTVQVAQDTYHLTRDFFDFEDLGEKEVKGKRNPIHTYRPLRPRAARDGIEVLRCSGRSRFVGRSMDLEMLAGCFKLARDGRGQAIGVVGEPGVGKSRLVLELIESLPGGDCTCLEGGCYHYGETIAYMPILQILKDFFGMLDGEAESTSKEKVRRKLHSLSLDLETALSPVEEVLSLEVEDEVYLSLEPVHKRERVFEAISNLLVAESRRRTLVLVVEDLHWSDRTSEEFLARFIEQMAATSILLVMLYRPEYAPPWAGAESFSIVGLDQLPGKMCSELVASILSDAPVSDELDDFIISRTTGNPLFIEELTRDLRESDSIVRTGGRYVLSCESSRYGIPDTIQGIIASRLDRLDETSKSTLQIASVIGREFAYHLLARVTSMKDELKGLLSGLQALEFIREKPSSRELEYLFKHGLTQEVAYNSLLLKKRRDLHERIGDALEGLYPDRLEEFFEILAHHYSRSGNVERALHYLKLAGDKAARSYSNWEAIAFYREAVQLLDTLPVTVENKKKKLEVCLALQDPLAFLNYPEGSAEFMEEAEELAGEVASAGSLANTYRKLSRYWAVQGNAPRALEYSEKSLGLAMETGDVESIARVAFDVCNARFVAADLVGAAGITRSALGMIEERHRETDLYYSGTWTAYSALAGCSGLALAGLGEFLECADVLEKGLRFSLARLDLLGEAWVEYCHLPLYFHKGATESLIEQSKKAIEHFEDVGAEFFLGMCWSYLACGQYFLGNHHEARVCAERGVELGRATGLPNNLPLNFVALSLAESGLENHEAAEKAAIEALGISRELDARQFEAYALLMLGVAVGHSRPSEMDTAEKHIRCGIRIAEEQHRKPSIFHGLIFLGEILSLAGRRDEAVETLQKAEAMGVQMCMSYWLTRTREALARVRRG